MKTTPSNTGVPSAQADSARIIVCKRKEDPFIRVPKTLMEDERLSWKAKGILIYLIGKPSDWKVRVVDLMNHGPDGRDSVRAGLMELRKAGYCELVALKEKGKVKEWVWKISDSPVFEPETGFPLLENPSITKKDSTKKESINKAKGTPTVVGASISDLPAQWKPDERTKEQRLASLKPPRASEYPSEQEFNDFLDTEELGGLDFRRSTDNIYQSLCLNKWRVYRGRRWIRIRDWKAFVRGLSAHIELNVNR